MSRRAILKDTTFLLGGTLLSRGLILLYRLLAARSLSVEDYAVLSLVISFFLMVIPFGFFNVAIPLSKFISEHAGTDRESVRRFYANALFLLLVTTCIVYFLLAGYLRSLPEGSGLSWRVYMVMGLGAFGYSIGMHNFGVLRGMKEVPVNAMLVTMNGVTRFGLLAALLLMWGSVDLETCIAIFFISNLIPTLLSFPVTWKMTGMSRGALRFHGPSAARIIHFSKYIVAVNVMLHSLDFAGRWVLGAFVDAESVAVIDVAFLFYTAVTMVMSTFVVILIPYVSEAHAASGKVKEPSRKPFLILGVVAAAASLSFMLLDAPLGSMVVDLLGKEEYSASVRIIAILVLAVPFHLLFSQYSGLVQGTGNPRTMTVTTGITVPIILPLMVLGAITLSVTGVALAFMLSYVLRCCILVFLYRRWHTEADPPVSGIDPPDDVSISPE